MLFKEVFGIGKSKYTLIFASEIEGAACAKELTITLWSILYDTTCARMAFNNTGLSDFANSKALQSSRSLYKVKN